MTPKTALSCRCGAGLVCGSDIVFLRAVGCSDYFGQYTVSTMRLGRTSPWCFRRLTTPDNPDTRQDCRNGFPVVTDRRLMRLIMTRSIVSVLVDAVNPSEYPGCRQASCEHSPSGDPRLDGEGAFTGYSGCQARAERRSSLCVSSRVYDSTRYRSDRSPRTAPQSARCSAVCWRHFR